MGSKQRRILLTFDVEGIPPNEDHLDASSLMCLLTVLRIMDERDFRGFFFVTAALAKQIAAYPELVEQLSKHQIGYHGPSHSSSLPILQYTDVPSYTHAVETSIESESSSTSFENLAAGNSHGLNTLREIFRTNDITCFRAPFLVWTPPYLEALKTLGVKFDFSSYVSDTPVTHKGIIFYPGPITIDDMLSTFVTKPDPRSLPRLVADLLLRREVSVLHFHPSSLLLHHYLYPKNRQTLRGTTEIKLAISMLRLLCQRIDVLQRSSLVEVTCALKQDWQTLKPGELDISKVYSLALRNAVNHLNYHPRHIPAHFKHFFDQEKTTDANRGSQA